MVVLQSLCLGSTLFARIPNLL
uniref:Uncharacterized protein n=1 Tax=Arundo donax TaxID=35708 RepID=A0A0A9BM12_ARUDO